MASATNLSSNDRSVLSALFDSEGLPSRDAAFRHETLSIPGISPRGLEELQRREANAIKALNEELPSRERIEDSIAELSSIIEETPTYPSAWNNRAQAVRMIVGDNLLDSSTASSSLYSDLCHAIRLASTSDSEAQHSSPQNNRLLAASYTLRAHLVYRASKSVTQDMSQSQSLPEELRGADGTQLERMAAADFRQGGRYGNEIAKQMAIQLNPYAKMCGEIVREAMIADLKESGVIPAELQA